MLKTTTRDKVIQAAMELMRNRGYAATTVDDIVKEAGVAKGSVYHAFKSKEELAIASLSDFVAKGQRILADGPYLEIEDPVERALGFLRHIEDKSSQLWSHGCLLGSIAIEVADSYPAVIRQIDRLFNQLETGMASIFAPALEAQGVTEVTAQDLSVHLLAVIEGSIIAAKSHSRPQYLQDGIRQYRRYLELLLK
jgi:TetR/AcrR family transcriptional repressor of nem operon